MDTLRRDELYELWKQSNLKTQRAIRELNHRFHTITQQANFLEDSREKYRIIREQVIDRLVNEIKQLLISRNSTISYYNPYSNKKIRLHMSSSKYVANIYDINDDDTLEITGKYNDDDLRFMLNNIDEFSINLYDIVVTDTDDYRKWFNLAYDSYVTSGLYIFSLNIHVLKIRSKEVINAYVQEEINKGL